MNEWAANEGTHNFEAPKKNSQQSAKKAQCQLKSLPWHESRGYVCRIVCGNQRPCCLRHVEFCDYVKNYVENVNKQLKFGFQARISPWRRVSCLHQNIVPKIKLHIFAKNKTFL